MRGLKNLIRVHSWQLDEHRRKLADMQRLKDDFLSRIAQLEADVKKEQKAAAEDNIVNFSYATYAAAVMERRETLQASIADLDPEIDRAEGEVSDAYRELKKYELALEVRERHKAAEMARREQNEMDEMGLNIYRRGLDDRS